MRSKEWQTEIDGLEAILRLVKYHEEMIVKELPTTIEDLTHECKNLRSQVTRAAMQAVAVMANQIDTEIDVKEVKELITVLMTRSADTNQFIKQGRIWQRRHNIISFRHSGRKKLLMGIFLFRSLFQENLASHVIPKVFF